MRLIFLLVESPDRRLSRPHGEWVCDASYRFVFAPLTDTPSGHLGPVVHVLTGNFGSYGFHSSFSRSVLTGPIQDRNLSVKGPLTSPGCTRPI